MKALYLAGILTASAALSAQPVVIDLLNSGFEAGLDGWTMAPGPAEMVTVESLENDGGHAAKLTANAANVGINSAPLRIGKDLRRDQVYRVSARLRFDGLAKGVAAFSVCAYNEAGTRVAQYAIQRWTTASQPHDWVTRAAQIGPGTDKPFPADAASIRLRVSFYDADGDPAGTVWVDDASVVEESVTNAAARWPNAILVTCDDLQVRFESRSFWTLYRIDYQGDRLCKDQFGSHYGTVASVAGTGFIGSGHTENGETEQIDELTIEIDGETVETPKPEYEARTVVFYKRSRIRDLVLNTTVTVADNRILEEVKMTAAEPVKLNLIYHFMHPWVTDVTHYAGELLDGEIVQGEFQGDKGMRIAAPVSWSAVYSTSIGKGAVTVVLEVPKDVPWNVRYWDVPDRYRKHYFMTFAGKTVPVGPTYSYRVLTIPFATETEKWLPRARSIAGEILARQ